MRYSAIRQHLKPYSILGRRRTTVNHAFAAAVAPCDAYDETLVRESILHLEQDPDADLKCVYCAAPAETWDHLNATVRKTVFSGFGHRLGNLLPCCKPCNSRKGNKTWQTHLRSLKLGEAECSRRERLIGNHISQRLKEDRIDDSPEYAELLKVRAQVLALFARADELATQIRSKSTATSNTAETRWNHRTI
ncbi:MAG TPA: hypothetical protein VHC90_19000 [Bryobacteraceae bacterium]|nr:hypothetical protein [Bryobacteraceae bacterium]